MFTNNFSQPLIDRKIDGKSWMTTIKIKDYLKIISLDDNPFQRNLLKSTFYKKLIDDLLNDTVMPPISIVWPEKEFSIDYMSELEKKCLIIDGLQRTNCLFICKNLLEKGGAGDFYFRDVDVFLEKEIYVEVWEKLDLKKMLYKMVVLNTGQKKMDYSHQLDILNDSVKEKLDEYGVSYLTTKEKNEEGNDKSKFTLAAITEGLVSYINKFPMSGKRSAADFLFENFNVALESNTENEILSIINDDKTYENLKWALVDFNNLLSDKYGINNPLKRYDVFLIGLLAALGFSYNKYPERLSENKERLLDMLKSEDHDPLKIEEYTVFSQKFKSGIGEKRRKMVFEAFKYYFTSKPEIEEIIEWGEAYDRN